MKVKPISFVTKKKLAELTGYTVAAIETKVRDGVWREGVIYVKSPDGRLHFNLEEYENWVQSGKQA
ncbi:putative phage excisionase [Marinobacterium iners]|jgi:hypothetical protein|uniref:excisionase n=1 Tax=Marinobacterium iners TaxID=48076 RepID=UPI001A8E34BF|nr:excisionase [Marinobacterium iners]QSR37038.1 putative phage excisionase [Marinobacterium iners]